MSLPRISCLAAALAAGLCAGATLAQDTGPRSYFLADIDIPDGTWLLLAPSAWVQDGETLTDADPAYYVIRDTDLIRQGADQIWYDTGKEGELGMLALSMVFLSPPANGTSREFAVLRLPDGSARWFTYSILGTAGTGGLPPHDLANLLEAADPVFQHDLLVGRADYDALAKRITTDPAIFTFDPLPPPDPMLAYAQRSDLIFPSVILPLGEMTEERIASEKAEAKQRFSAQFGPPGQGYADFTLLRQNCPPPQITDANGTPVLVKGAPLILPGFATLTLQATLYSDATLPDRIEAGAEAFGPYHHPGEVLDTALANVLTANLGAVNPDDYSISIDCFSAELQAFWPQDNTQYLSYFEIIPRPTP